MTNVLLWYGRGEKKRYKLPKHLQTKGVRDVAKYTDSQVQSLARRLPLAFSKANGNLTETAKSLDLTRRQLMGLVGQYPPLGGSLQRAENDLYDRIEAKLHEIALDPGAKGNRGVNLTGAIFTLKCRRGERWNDRQTVVVEDKTTYATAIGQRDVDDAATTDTPLISIINGGLIDTDSRATRGEGDDHKANGGIPPEHGGTHE